VIPVLVVFPWVERDLYQPVGSGPDSTNAGGGKPKATMHDGDLCEGRERGAQRPRALPAL
jgi:hypothetical protein